LPVIELNEKLFRNNKVDKILENFDNWDFDLLKYYHALGDKTILHFGFKIFHSYGLLDKFSIADNNLKNLLINIFEAYYPNN